MQMVSLHLHLRRRRIRKLSDNVDSVSQFSSECRFYKSRVVEFVLSLFYLSSTEISDLHHVLEKRFILFYFTLLTMLNTNGESESFHNLASTDRKSVV